MQITIEERFGKIKNKKLLRIFPINTVIDIQKLTKENKDKKNFSFLYKEVFPLYYLPCPCT